ncbi:MAG TPA: hypothetical protein PKC89_11195 [Pyrinomonadaceae bacterium]|nr:hypothetical protein [Pyrinomonadaceae bacterium]
MKITPFQHSQVLGYALFGFGIFQAFGVVNLLWTTWGTLHSLGQLFVPTVLGAIIICLASLFAGHMIWQREYDPKTPGLIFVLCAIGAVPLGTILSAYVLLYLFVFYKDESDESE